MRLLFDIYPNPIRPFCKYFIHTCPLPFTSQEKKKQEGERRWWESWKIERNKLNTNQVRVKKIYLTEKKQNREKIRKSKSVDKAV